MIHRTRRLTPAALVFVAAAALGGCMLPALPGSTTVNATCVSCTGNARVEVTIGTPDSSPASLPNLAGSVLSGPAPHSTQQPPAGEDTPSSPAGAVSDATADGAGVDIELLKDTLRVAEGLELDEYDDTEGVPHIGYGHQVTPAEAEALLQEDALEAVAGARRVVGEPTWSALSEPRRRALAECAFANGATGLARYTDLLRALRAHDYAGAAAALADSVWASKAPMRVARLAELLRRG